MIQENVIQGKGMDFSVENRKFDNRTRFSIQTRRHKAISELTVLPTVVIILLKYLKLNVSGNGKEGLCLSQSRV